MKNKVKTSFSRAAATYHSHANLQEEAAGKLVAFVQQALSKKPTEILEIGAGTGKCSVLCQIAFPEASLFVTDISAEMLLQHPFVTSQHHTLAVMDGERLAYRSFDGLAISNMTMQWFADPLASINHQISLASTVAFSLPLDGSLVEWHNWCLRHNNLQQTIPFLSLQKVLDACVHLQPKKLKYEVLTLRQDFTSPLDFIRSLKNIGATASIHTTPFLRNIRYCDPEFQGVTYKIGLFVIER